MVATVSPSLARSPGAPRALGPPEAKKAKVVARRPVGRPALRPAAAPTTLVDARRALREGMSWQAACVELCLPRRSLEDWETTFQRWCGVDSEQTVARLLSEGADVSPLEHDLAAAWLVERGDAAQARACATRYVAQVCGARLDDRHFSRLLEATHDFAGKGAGGCEQAVRMLAALGGTAASANALILKLAQNIHAPVPPVDGGLALQVLVAAAQETAAARAQRGAKRKGAAGAGHAPPAEHRPGLAGALLGKLSAEQALSFVSLYRIRCELLDTHAFADAVAHLAPSDAGAHKRVVAALNGAKALWGDVGHDVTVAFQQTCEALLGVGVANDQ